MKTVARSDRVGCHIQKVLSELLQKNVKDPRLNLVTITNVKVSRDLKAARIYFAVSGGKKNVQKATEGFQSALGYLKRILAGQLGLRYMPALKIYYDESFDYGSHIDNIFKSMKVDNGTDNTLFEA